VFNHPRPNQRDKNKKLVGFFATEAEKKALQKAAKQVAKVTKTNLPKGEDLLGDPALKAQFIAAKSGKR